MRKVSLYLADQTAAWLEGLTRDDSGAEVCSLPEALAMLVEEARADGWTPFGGFAGEAPAIPPVVGVVSRLAPRCGGEDTPPERTEAMRLEEGFAGPFGPWPDELPPEVCDETPTERKARFLEALGYDIGQACSDTSIGLAEVERWRQEDEAFARRVDERRWIGLSRLEKALEAIGTGGEGNALALMAILNAHHPAYGKQARESVDRVLVPHDRMVLDMLRRYLGPEDLERFSRELEAAAAWAKRKLS